MCDDSGIQKPTRIITTSWDDGHPLDIRLAELLATFGLKGTFYVPISYDAKKILDYGQLRYLMQMGMEIGSHTLTHPILTKLDKETVSGELVESKKKLEDILGDNVQAFCYPGGKFNKRTRDMVISAGYVLGRTTLGFRIDTDFDPFLMPVSLQFYPHQRQVLFTHLLKEVNLRGLRNWIGYRHFNTDIILLTKCLLDSVTKKQGVLHIWGHSWEIEKYGLWDLLKETLSCVSNQKNVMYCTNTEVIKTINKTKIAI
ncbi:MAG: polysaccharide deacetylase family protein [Anaerolineales bacterium]|jgi:peptidoglycan/xylan/chitin deacetylase (PgdA/CDA1 family)